MEFYLNMDHSIICNVDNEGNLTIKTRGRNPRSARMLAENIRAITKVKKKGSRFVILVNGLPYCYFHKRAKEVTYIHQLTSFETKEFAQGNFTGTLPFHRDSKRKQPLVTDLHTHLSSALSPSKLIKAAKGNGVYLSASYLETVGISTDGLKSNEQGLFLLDDILKVDDNYHKLCDAMKIETTEQETFNHMETIYALREPFTKSEAVFIPMLRVIAEEAKKQGIKYIEFSATTVFKKPNLLQLLDEHMPEIEKEFGVKIRFLGAMVRTAPGEKNTDMVDILKVSSQSPYVVGCDFIGHETNPTADFYNQIKELAKHAMLNDPDFVIRVHAGENSMFRRNVRDSLLAIEEAHFELLQETGKDYPYPQVRIGHGIYGFDEKSSRHESERTADKTVADLCREIGAIVEFNMSSNLSLNNINSISEIPIKEYADAGIRVVLGTDGGGIYSTTISQEMILAREAGLTKADFDKIRKTEKEIIERAERRFKSKSESNLTAITFSIESGECYRYGAPCYTEEIKTREIENASNSHKLLEQKIAHSGAETDPDKITEATRGKVPIMITGSSASHWPTLSAESQDKVKELLYVLVRCIDPDKAYFVTGGTNYGVEKQLHEIAHEQSKKTGKQIIVLGTLTEEAAKENGNDIEPDTITHAFIPTLNGRPAKRWMDLPDTVLAMVGNQHGHVIAIGGGAVTSDMIQRTHNMGIDMSIMAGIEGASGSKAEHLAGNGYEFHDIRTLLANLLKEHRHVLREDIFTEEFLNSNMNELPEIIEQMIIDARKAVRKEKVEHTRGTKIAFTEPRPSKKQSPAQKTEKQTPSQGKVKI